MLVRFYLSIMFADPTSLGWDPTMKYVASDGLPQYTIEAHSEDEKPVVYRTVELVSSVGTNGIQRRGTRVWRVVRDDMPNEPPAILKDSWIDSERQRQAEREGCTLNVAAQASAGPDQKEDTAAHVKGESDKQADGQGKDRSDSSKQVKSSEPEKNLAPLVQWFPMAMI